MSFWLGARELSIDWSEDSRYWKWTKDNSCSSEVAELLNVCWLAIFGKIDVKRLHVKTSYSAFLVFKLQDRSANLDKAIVYVQPVKEISDESNNEGYTAFFRTKKRSDEKGRFAQQRNDGWMEIKLGDFFNNLGDDGEVKMKLLANDSKWKSGLVVRGIEIRPN